EPPRRVQFVTYDQLRLVVPPRCGGLVQPGTSWQRWHNRPSPNYQKPEGRVARRCLAPRIDPAPEPRELGMKELVLRSGGYEQVLLLRRSQEVSVSSAIGADNYS